MIYVACGFWTPIRRSDEYDYIRGIEISVYVQEDENILLGCYHAERWVKEQWQKQSEGWEVCDG